MANEKSTPSALKKIGTAFRAAFRALFRVLGIALAFLFGRPSFSYRPPVWLVPGIPAAVRGVGRFFRWYFDFRSNRVPVRVLKAALGLCVAAGLALGAAWAFQDRSGWVGFSVAAPEPTPLEKDATYSVLSIDFDGSAAAADLADKTLSEGVALEPPVKGSWSWQGDSSLVFSPSEDWAPATDYRVALAPAIFREGLKLRSREARFSTAPFEASLSDVRFEVSPENEADRRVRGTVVFNYAVDVDSLSGKVELKVAGGKSLGSMKTVPVSISFDEFQGKAFISSDVLPVPADRVRVSLGVKGGVKSRSGGAVLSGSLEAETEVPGLYDKVWYEGVDLSVVRNENYEYEQTLSVLLSGEVSVDKIAGAIEAWVLPADRIGIPGYEDEKNHLWSAEEVDRNVLAKARRVELIPLPAERDAASVVSFKYQAPAGRALYVRLEGKVPAYGGYIVKEPLAVAQEIPEIPKALDIMHAGSILSLGGEKTISVVSNDVASVRFRAFRLFPDQVNHLITQTYGPFAEPNFENWYSFNELDLSVVYEDIRSLPVREPGAVQYDSFDFSSYLKKQTDPREKYGLFMLKVAEWNRQDKEETDLSSRRFILVTDLGILAKRSADGSYDVFVQDIRTGRPRSGAEVEVIGRNGVPVVAETTDAAGRVRIPDLKGFREEKQPVAFTARAGGDFSFLPLNREDRFLEYSRFDIGGVRGASKPDKLAAFVFSDRGLYRPGDAIHVAYIVKAGDWAVPLEGLPLETKVFDPRGVEVLKEQTRLSASGFAEIGYRTFETSTSGRYRFEVSLVKPDNRREFLGNTQVRVEEFVPDRLTISSRIPGSEDRAWIPFSAVKASVRLMNLYGTAAAGNPVRAAFRLSPRSFAFPKFPDYRFQDAWETDKYYEEALPEGATNEAGDADFSIDLSKFEPATFLLTFTAEGLEKQGGRGVTAESSVVVSPLSRIVGWKADGRLDYIAKGAARRARFIAIDPYQKPVEVRDLRFALDEIRYVSVLTKQEDGSYRYQSVRKTFRVDSGPVVLGEAGLDYPLATANPGDFELSLLEKDDRVAAKVAYSVVGVGNLTRSLDRNAELQIKLDRTDYEVGDEIELQIKAPYAGSGLITIEREKVYAASWFSADGTASVQRIRVPAGLEGSAYVNVAFIRAVDSREVYMSPLSYGVEPFRVSVAKRAVAVELGVPAEAKPGRPFEISYRTDRPSRIVVYAVDEGILQPARYETPAPLPFFFKKRALEVGTSQILDLILPEFSVVRELMRMGGDGDVLRSRQNPFKRKQHVPVAYWSGILDAGPEARTVSYAIPSYFNGTLRVMAVAVAPDAVGAAEKRSIIRNDFVISPTLPLFVAPGDTFKMGVAVSNNAPVRDAAGEAEIALTATGSGGAAVVGEARKTIRLARGAEGVLWFDVKAGAAPGAASIDFVASSGEYSSDLSEGLSIRPAVPWREKISSGVLTGNSAKIEVPRRLLAEYRKLSLSLSFKPAALNVGLLSFLADYPYGCSEQVVSRAFPALLLADDPASGVDRAAAEKYFAETLRVLRARQTAEGAIGLWGANDTADDWVTVYAAHFLTEAASRGWTAGDDVKRRALSYISGRIARDSKKIAGEPAVAAYAAWVVALNGKVSTNLILDVRSALDKRGGDWKKDPVALYLAGAYAQLKQQKECDALLASYGDGRKTGDEGPFYDSALHRLAMRVYMTARYRTDNASASDAAILERMVDLVEKNEFSTVSSAWAVLAFRAYGERAPDIGPGNAETYAVGSDGKETRLPVGAGGVVQVPYGPDAVSLRVVNKGGVPLYWQAVQTGFDAAVPDKPVLEGIEVFREFRDSSGKAVTSARRGDELTAVVRVRSSGKKKVGSVAVTDLLPGGFELALDQAGNRPFNALIEGNMVREYAEAREDRVLAFGEVGSGLTEFRYPVKATTAGTFAIPASGAEAMYDRNVRGESAGGAFTVTE
jgi:uncharacterized protein YfaS (alpha-2-macroglobulin family)